MITRYPGYSYEIHDDDTDESIARAMVIEYDDGCFIDSIAVSEEHQGKGYGTQLLQLLIKEYSNVRLYLLVDSYGSERLDNEALEAWYSRYGFMRCGKYMERLPKITP